MIPLVDVVRANRRRRPRWSSRRKSATRPSWSRGMFPASAATACSTRSGGKRSVLSKTETAPPRPWIRWSSPASGVALRCSARSRMPNWWEPIPPPTSAGACASISTAVQTRRPAFDGPSPGGRPGLSTGRGFRASTDEEADAVRLRVSRHSGQLEETLQDRKPDRPIGRETEEIPCRPSLQFEILHEFQAFPAAGPRPVHLRNPRRNRVRRRQPHLHEANGRPAVIAAGPCFAPGPPGCRSPRRRAG